MNKNEKWYYKTQGIKVIGFYEYFEEGCIEISEEEKDLLLEENRKGKELILLGNKITAIVKSLPPEKLIKPIFCYESLSWKEEATLEEQIEYYKNLIIQKTKEIETEKLAGFRNPKLELELNELKKIHLEKSHELALQIENRLREVQV